MHATYPTHALNSLIIFIYLTTYFPFHFHKYIQKQETAQFRALPF